MIRVVNGRFSMPSGREGTRWVGEIGAKLDPPPGEN
jgi:hypothetical protein